MIENLTSVRFPEQESYTIETPTNKILFQKAKQKLNEYILKLKLKRSKLTLKSWLSSSSSNINSYSSLDIPGKVLQYNSSSDVAFARSMSI